MPGYLLYVSSCATLKLSNNTIIYQKYDDNSTQYPYISYYSPNNLGTQFIVDGVCKNKAECAGTIKSNVEGTELYIGKNNCKNIQEGNMIYNENGSNTYSPAIASISNDESLTELNNITLVTKGLTLLNSTELSQLNKCCINQSVKNNSMYYWNLNNNNTYNSYKIIFETTDHFITADDLLSIIKINEINYSTDISYIYCDLNDKFTLKANFNSSKTKNQKFIINDIEKTYSDCNIDNIALLEILNMVGINVSNDIDTITIKVKS